MQDLIKILFDAGNAREARDKMLIYFGMDEDKMFDSVEYLGSEGYLSYDEINMQGQRRPAPRITRINKAKCKSYFE